MALSDDLGKQDNFVGNVTTKLAKQLAELSIDVDDNGDGGSSSNSNNNNNAGVNLDELLTVGQAYLDPWMKKWKWEAGRWDYEKNSLQFITEDIVKIASRVDADLRTKTQEWLQLNRNITAAQSVATGSVLMRDLSDVLEERHIIDTESLKTLLVVVPNANLKEWFDTFESLEVDDLKERMGGGPFSGRVVMPKSSQVVVADTENTLVTMTILRPFEEQIKVTLREKRFTPREYNFEKDAGANQEKDMNALLERRKVAKLELHKYAKTHFTELFTCWVHLKAVRVWVESVLRFSLPADFDVILIRPSEKKFFERIRKVLGDLFKGLVAEGVLDVAVDEHTQGVGALASEELFPYVFSEINIQLSRF